MSTDPVVVDLKPLRARFVQRGTVFHPLIQLAVQSRLLWWLFITQDIRVQEPSVIADSVLGNIHACVIRVVHFRNLELKGQKSRFCG